MGSLVIAIIFPVMPSRFIKTEMVHRCMPTKAAAKSRRICNGAACANANKDAFSDAQWDFFSPNRGKFMGKCRHCLENHLMQIILSVKKRKKRKKRRKTKKRADGESSPPPPLITSSTASS